MARELPGPAGAHGHGAHVEHGVPAALQRFGRLPARDERRVPKDDDPERAHHLRSPVQGRDLGRRQPGHRRRGRALGGARGGRGLPQGHGAEADPGLLGRLEQRRRREHAAEQPVPRRAHREVSRVRGDDRALALRPAIDDDAAAARQGVAAGPLRHLRRVADPAARPGRRRGAGHRGGAVALSAQIKLSGRASSTPSTRRQHDGVVVWSLAAREPDSLVDLCTGRSTRA